VELTAAAHLLINLINLINADLPSYFGTNSLLIGL
jgi:hypothetical protein